MFEVHKMGLWWFVLALACSIALSGCSSFLEVECKESADCWTKSVGDFQLRVRKEPSGYMTYTYIFERRNSTNGWKHLHDLKRNEPIRMPDIQIEVLTPKDGYFFAGPIVGLSSDAGETWSVTNLQQIERPSCETVWIERLEVEASGMKAIVAQHPTRNESCPDFISNDFGKSWNRLDRN